MKRIAFTAPRTAAVVDVPDFSGPVPPRDVRGRTLISLVSPGTELNAGFLAKNFPVYLGYACVFQVEEVGAEVTDLPVGTIVFASGGHHDRQQVARDTVLPLPAGLAVEAAVFARLAGVSMSTLNTTTAHPPARVLVTGLGPVGNLAAQIFSACGYRVTAVDPVDARRESARKLGLADVRASLADGTPDITDQVALHVECSGHEQAVLDGCRCVQKRGEVVMVGTPWKRRTEIYAQEIFWAIFKRYVVLRSGWEWEVPEQPTAFQGHSLMGNYAAAMEWLANGRVRVDGLASTFAPDKAQEVYEGLYNQTLATPAALFDWR